ncbi:MAG: hypothetical protein IT223_06955, partial [Crocinitomicaceae bacterium]|nr:hypothetical protein [Crocinitomicaceae bacterium]
MMRSLYLCGLFVLGCLGNLHAQSSGDKVDLSAARELKEFRSANSKTYIDADGHYYTQMTGGYFHYKNSSDEWTTLQETISAGTGGQYGIFSTDLPLSVNPSDGTTNMLLEKKDGNIYFGKNSVIEMMDDQGNILSVIEKNPELTYQTSENGVQINNFFNGIDRLQTLRYWDLKTDYLLHDKPSFPSGASTMAFSDELTLPQGWTIVPFFGEETAQGWRGSLKILNASGLQVAIISEAKFYDTFSTSTTEKRFDEIHAIIGDYYLENTANGYIIKLMVPVDWLERKELVYPVVIDPTISNTYANTFGVMDHFVQFTPACQANLNVTLPPGPNYIVSNTSTQYNIMAMGTIAVMDLTTYYAAGFEQYSRVGFGGNWTSTMQGYGNSQSPQLVVYSLPNLSIANGCYPGGSVLTFNWQAYQEYFPPLQGPASVNVYGCVQNYQYLVANSWIVTVTYDIAQVDAIVSPTSQTLCSGESTSFNLSTSPAGGSLNWTVLSGGLTGATDGSGNQISQTLATTGNDPGTATYTVTPTYMGCAGTPQMVTVEVNPEYSVSIEHSMCPGETYSFNGTEYSQEGTYQAFLQTSSGCDSTVTLNLTVNSTIYSNQSVHICQGETYSFNGNELSQQGQYEATFLSTGGCDSIVTLDLDVLPVYNESINETICQGASYSFGGTSYSNNGAYEHTFQSATGCDSTVTLFLTVTIPPFSEFGYTICQGESYAFAGNNYTQTGDYTSVFTTTAGCDSLVTLHLLVIPTVTQALDITICEGQSYFLNGTEY